MSKIQSIIYLIIFIILLFSMDQIFYNEIRYSLRETFSSMKGTGYGYIGKKLDYKIQFNSNSLNGNMIYPDSTKSGFLAVEPPLTFAKNSDDHPLYYGFPSFS